MLERYTLTDRLELTAQSTGKLFNCLLNLGFYANALSELEERNRKCLEDLRTTDPRDDKKRIEQTKGGLLEDSYR